jgi:hypothetical protein
MPTERRSGTGVLVFTVLAVAGTILGIVGLVLGIAKEPAVKLAATVLTWSGGVLLGLVVLLVIRAAYRDAVAWLRDYFPSARRRGEIAGPRRASVCGKATLWIWTSRSVPTSAGSIRSSPAPGAATRSRSSTAGAGCEPWGTTRSSGGRA